MSKEILNKSLQNKITYFIKNNSKNLIYVSILLILILFSYFFYNDLQKKKEIKISEQYMQASMQFKKNKNDLAKQQLLIVIDENHKFYSPLALYFIIENKLEEDPLKIINFFDKILSIKAIDKENLNLIKIKKAIFLFSFGNEELMTKTLNPIINSDSVWRSMAIRLISDYFLSKDQKLKAENYIKLLNDKKKK
jgi:predicted negative regulator of RcsB-dependent stress response